MKYRLLGAALVAVVLSLTSGCAVNKMSSKLMPGADLSKVRTIYVEKVEADGRGIDKLIVANLEKRGYTASSGPKQTPPDSADALLTYDDKWMWDITMYMLQLQITLRDKSSFPLANAVSLHTSLTRKSPTEMVEEVIGNLLTAKP